MPKELIISIVFIFLAAALTDMFHGFMPSQFQMMVLAVIVISYAVFSAFIFRERAHDEREEQHLYRSGRVAFLFGICILVVGIVIQTFRHALDPVLVWTLTMMVVVKLLSLWIMRKIEE